MSDIPPAPSPPPRSAWHHALAWGARALLWLPATVLGAVLAGALALGIWAASEGSLAQALRWGLAWQAEHAPAAGRITVGDAAQGTSDSEGTKVSGSVFGGGAIAVVLSSQNTIQQLNDGQEPATGDSFFEADALNNVVLAEVFAGDDLASIESVTLDVTGNEIQALALANAVANNLRVSALTMDSPGNAFTRAYSDEFATGAGAGLVVINQQRGLADQIVIGTVELFQHSLLLNRQFRDHTVQK